MKVRLLQLTVLVLAMVSCDTGGGDLGDSGSGGGGYTPPEPVTVDKPTATPDSRMVAPRTEVTLASTTPGAVIYYTTDLSEPTASSTRYTRPIKISRDCTTLRAIAVQGGVSSDPMGAFYTLNKATLAQGAQTLTVPVASPAGGAVAAGTIITLTSTAGADIYYTTDGSDPRTSNTRSHFSSPPVISVATTLRAYAQKSGATDSRILTAYYSISVPAMEADDLPSVPGPNDLLNQQKFYGVYEAATNAGETLLSVLQRDWIPRITSCYNSLSGFVPADALSLVLTEAANPQSQILADKVTLIYDYDIVLASYTDWVQPDNTFSLSMSETTQTAILNSLTEGLEASVGLSAFGFSASLKASISSTSSTTYTTISGKTVTQTWNLRDFDQNYVYKVVLVGRVKTVRQDPTIYGYYNAVLYNTPVDTAWVDQNSLTMKLVRRPR